VEGLAADLPAKPPKNFITQTGSATKVNFFFFLISKMSQEGKAMRGGLRTHTRGAREKGNREEERERKTRKKQRKTRKKQRKTRKKGPKKGVLS
jgi:hypothetical protein